MKGPLAQSAALLILLAPQLGLAEEEPFRMFFSTELKSDPAQMTEAEQLKPGVPLYFVVIANSDHTLGELASTHPKTGERNIHVCFDMNSSRVGSVCVGVLKSPVSEQQLKSKGAMFTLIPATNELEGENIAVIRKILDMVDSLHQDVDIKTTYTYFGTEKRFASFRAPLSLKDYEKSRWYEYNQLFVHRESAANKAAREVEAAARKEKELKTVVVPKAAMRDAALERQLLAAAQAMFGATNRIYRAIFTSSDWSYEKNPFGILMSRAAYVVIMRKETSTGSCFVDQSRYAKQEFLSGNTWASLKLHQRDEPSILHINCDKFVGLK
jgi:hypothetical protein